jgi:Uma2 family endonuclease
MSIVSQTAVSEPVAMVLPALISSPSGIKGPAPKRWTREEYYRLGEQGWFHNQRVELIDGEIVQLSPQSPHHSSGSDKIRALLQQIFGDAYWIRMQLPLKHGNFSEPEPDVSVVRGTLEEHEDNHPTTAVLVVEVSRTSLEYDKSTKPLLYSAMAIPEYWVVDLANRKLIVHREPVVDQRNSFGSRYASIVVLDEEASISPLEAPTVSIPISKMLPRMK